MTTVYEMDTWGVFVRAAEVDERDSITFPFVLQAPPALQPGQYARQVAGQWQVIEAHPRDAVEPVPPAQRPRVVVTAVTADAPVRGLTISETGLSEVTLPVGARIHITAEMRLGDQLLVQDGDFRMPLVSRDGRQRVVLAAMAGGIITISALLDDSRVWHVTDDMINVDLPEEEKLDFGGFRIFVVE